MELGEKLKWSPDQVKQVRLIDRAFQVSAREEKPSLDRLEVQDGDQVAPRVSWKRRRGSEQLISANGPIQGGLRPMNVDGHLLWSNYSFPPGRYEDFQLWDGSNSYPLPASPEAGSNIYGISDSGVCFSASDRRVGQSQAAANWR